MFRPNEIQRVKQQDVNAYTQLNFGGNDTRFAGVGLSGNIGVRFVNTQLLSFGASRIPNQGDLGVTNNYSVINPVTGVDTGRCAAGIPAGAPPGTTARTPGGVCNLGPAGYALLQRFSGVNAAIVPNEVTNSYSYFLPSANLKLAFSPKLQMRLAASKVLTRPESSYVRSFLELSVDGNGALVANVGNPKLRPATAWQFDAMYVDERWVAGFIERTAELGRVLNGLINSKRGGTGKH